MMKKVSEKMRIPKMAAQYPVICQQGLSDINASELLAFRAAQHEKSSCG